MPQNPIEIGSAEIRIGRSQVEKRKVAPLTPKPSRTSHNQVRLPEPRDPLARSAETYRRILGGERRFYVGFQPVKIARNEPNQKFTHQNRHQGESQGPFSNLGKHRTVWVLGVNLGPGQHPPTPLAQDLRGASTFCR